MRRGLWTGYFLLISLLILVTLEVAARWRWRLCNGCVVYVRQKILAIARDLELPTIDVIQRSSSWGGYSAVSDAVGAQFNSRGHALVADLLVDFFCSSGRANQMSSARCPDGRGR